MVFCNGVTYKMHAHICQVCAKNGKETVFVHSDDNAGNVAGHTCPECGSIEWKKAIVRQPNKAHVHRNVPPQKSLLDQLLYGIFLLLLIYVAMEIGFLVGDLFALMAKKDSAQ